MNTDTIEIKGYTVTIAQDECAPNPMKEFDCEPPLLVYNLDRHSSLDTYNDAPENLDDVIRLLPDSLFARGNRVAMIRRFLDCTLREFAETKDNWGYNDKGAFSEIISEEKGNTPEGWGTTQEWLPTVEALLDYAGIPCHYTQSNGYSQGDSVLLLAIATPAWCKTVGCTGKHRQSACENACNLYGAWAWGDVYGVQSIESPDGEELDHGSCWGFYGTDHKESGLLEHAESAIAWHMKKRAKVQFIAANMSLA